MAKNDVRRVLAVGGAVGALHAFCSVLRGLPVNFPAGILLVLHADSVTPGAVIETISRSTSFSVHYAKKRDTVRGRCLLIAPPGSPMLAVPPGRVRVRQFDSH